MGSSHGPVGYEGLRLRRQRAFAKQFVAEVPILRISERTNHGLASLVTISALLC
jgi:hypothetical protein